MPVAGKEEEEEVEPRLPQQLEVTLTTMWRRRKKRRRMLSMG
jgi:hypothetical protein